MENHSETIGVTKKDVLQFAEERFNVLPEYLWQKYPEYFVLRRKDDKKWFAVFMSVKKIALNISDDGKADILAVKCDPQMRDILLHENGVLPAYHMNREHWICVLLDGSVRKDLVFGLIEESFDAACKNAKGKVKNA